MRQRQRLDGAIVRLKPARIVPQVEGSDTTAAGTLHESWFNDYHLSERIADRDVEDQVLFPPLFVPEADLVR